MIRVLRSTARGESGIIKIFAFALSAFPFKAFREWNQLPDRLKMCVFFDTDISRFLPDISKIDFNKPCQH